MQVWLLFRKDAPSSPCQQRAQIAVLEENAGRLAAELESHRADEPPASAPIWRPAAVEPVNAILSTRGWATRAAPASRSPTTMLMHSIRDAGLQSGLGEDVCIERGLGRGLEHDRVAGRQSGRDLECRQRLGEIPGHDGSDDAERLTAHDRGAHHARLSALQGDALDDVRVDAHHHGRQPAVDLLGEPDRHPVLAGDERRCVAGARLERVGESAKSRSPFAGRGPAPGTVVEGPARGANSGVDVALGPESGHADHVAGGGLGLLAQDAAPRLYPLAVDEEACALDAAEPLNSEGHDYSFVCPRRRSDWRRSRRPCTDRIAGFFSHCQHAQ